MVSRLSLLLLLLRMLLLLCDLRLVVGDVMITGYLKSEDGRSYLSVGGCQEVEKDPFLRKGFSPPLYFVEQKQVPTTNTKAAAAPEEACGSSLFTFTFKNDGKVRIENHSGTEPRKSYLWCMAPGRSLGDVNFCKTATTTIITESVDFDYIQVSKSSDGKNSVYQFGSRGRALMIDDTNAESLCSDRPQAKFLRRVDSIPVAKAPKFYLFSASPDNSTKCIVPLPQSPPPTK